MSLMTLIRRPDIRAAFDRCATPARTPQHMRGCALLVPDAGGPRGLAGTAFDHLARAQILRDFAPSGVTIHDEKATLDHVEEYIDRIPTYPTYRKYLKHSIESAKHEAAEYAAGRGDISRLTNLFQDVAWAEMAYRSMGVPTPEFRPSVAVADELRRMLELFDPRRRFSPQTICILNPRFAVGGFVGGADADLVIDDALIDLKSTVKGSVEAEMMRQLAGYAALQRIGGIRMGDVVHDPVFRSVGIYFARYGLSAAWTIEELFPGTGFDQFCAAIEKEVTDGKRQFEMEMGRLTARQSKQRSQKKKSSKAKLGAK